MQGKTLRDRDALKKPFGELLFGEELEKRLLAIKDRDIICVGDNTSKFLLDRGFSPRIVVYDRKIKRAEIDTGTRAVIENYGEREICAKNPAGTITKEMENAIIEALESTVPLRVFIEGEEDLAALVVFMYAKNFSAILYGQPDQGMVITVQDDENRRKAWNIYESTFY